MRTKPSEPDLTPEIGTPAWGIRCDGILTEKRPAPGATMWLGIRGQTDEGQPFEVALAQPNAVADACPIGTRFRVTLERLGET